MAMSESPICQPLCSDGAKRPMFSHPPTYTTSSFFIRLTFVCHSSSASFLVSPVIVKFDLCSSV